METEERSVRFRLEDGGFRRGVERMTLTVDQFLRRASLVEQAYTQSLSRVQSALRQLGQAFLPVATVGMNLFAGLLRAVEPVAERISRLVTGLFGVTVWQPGSEAAEGMASSLRRVASSARSAARAQRDLYSFDRITRVSARGSGGSASGGSSGARGSAAPAIGGAWVQVTGALQQTLARLWQPFREAWELEGARVLKEAGTALDRLAGLAGALGQSWMAVWTDGTGTRLVSTVLQLAQNLLRTVGSPAGQFTLAWAAGGTGERIFRGLLGLAQTLLAGLRDMAAATAAWAAQLDFTPLLEGFAGLVEAAQPFAELASGALYWAYTNVLLPLADWVIGSAAPAGLNLLSGAVRLLTSALNLFRPVAQAVWEYLLKPMGNWTGSLLTTGLNLAASGMNTLSSAIGRLPSSWSGLQEQIGEAWGGIQNTLVTAASNCRTGVVSAFTSLASGAVSQVTSLGGRLKSAFGTLVSGVQSKLAGIKNAITTPVRNGLNAVVELVNKIIRKINSALKFSWPAIKVAGKVIVPAGSVTIARLPTISKLAEGGVALGPTLSLIGEAGREAVLPLDRNTGWMDRLAAVLARQLEERSAAGGGETVIEVYVGGERLARQVVREVNAQTRRTGVCPIYV